MLNEHGCCRYAPFITQRVKVGVVPQSGCLSVGFCLEGGHKRARQVEPRNKGGKAACLVKDGVSLEWLGCVRAETGDQSESGYWANMGDAWSQAQSLFSYYVWGLKALNLSQG